MDAAFLKARIAATKLIIVAYEDAVLALTTGGVQSYTLDTGQTNQTVTKLNVPALNRQLDALYNRCATMQARLTGSGTVTARPIW